jgi:glycosyltransferase involved in cell wall biosynthesis
VVFCVVGGGPLQAQVQARLTELQVPAQNFRLLGHREDAPALYPAFDVVALSSLYEGLPYVLLEAMAWGVPVVATDVLGSRDVVSAGETGLLARVDDPADIAAQLLNLLNDSQLRARFGAAARKRVAEEFSFAAFIDGHRNLYHVACSSD